MIKSYFKSLLIVGTVICLLSSACQTTPAPYDLNDKSSLVKRLAVKDDNTVPVLMVDEGEMVKYIMPVESSVRLDHWVFTLKNPLEVKTSLLHMFLSLEKMYFEDSLAEFYFKKTEAREMEFDSLMTLCITPKYEIIVHENEQ